MRFHLSLPTRVSRLYPIFALILLLNSSVLLYAWQVDRIKLSSYASFDEREASLKAQISTLLATQKEDRATLALQNQKIAEATAKLTALETDLATKGTQLKQAQDQLKNQQDQLSKNASELESLRGRPPLFSFQNTSSLANVEQKKADVKAIVTSAYDYIQTLYGQPYLLNSIIITFVDEFSIAGSSGEIVIENGSKGITINIHLKDFDKTDFQDINTVIHEIIHGFHGVAVFETSSIEEGMTVAATDAVMRAMIKDNKLPAFDQLYLTINKTQYDTWNQSLKVHKDNQAFYSNSSVAKVYQLIGYAWYELYKNDPTIFKKINAAYYPKVQKGLTPDTATALDAIRSSIKTVNGESIDSYLTANQAFNPS